MNIVVINGSPRKGNTHAAIDAFCQGASEKHSVEVIDAYKLSVAPCKGCDSCGCVNGCIDQDDTNMIADKFIAADMIVFATPVYWWGMSAQLKLIVDKLYCKAANMKGKSIGVIVCGGSPTDAEQYDLIRRQFKCIANYLNWDIRFHNDYYASAKTDFASDPAAVEEMKAAGAAL